MESVSIATRCFFVYGTLQTGFKNHVNVIKGRLEGEVAPATLAGAVLFHFSNAGFPGMWRAENVPELASSDESGSGAGASPAPSCVHGQLLTIPAALLLEVITDLDLLEDYYGPGHPNNTYEREEVTVTCSSDGRTVRAWTYFCRSIDRSNPAYGAVHVPHGNWRKHMQEQGLTDAGDDWADVLARADAAAAVKAGGEGAGGGSSGAAAMAPL